MPEICRFLGIIIYLYYDDHAPPHIHVKYNEHWASFDIQTLVLMEGRLPKRVHALVVEWMLDNQTALSLLWERALKHEPLPKLPPLE
jgi:hypothetical protein